MDHLLALNSMGFAGHVELCEADLVNPGSYDGALRGASAVVHAAAAVGYNKETPQEVYDGCFTSTRHIIESVKRCGTVKRLVFTSSGAALYHPGPKGHLYTEQGSSIFC